MAQVTTSDYNPFQHAEELGLQVEYQTLRTAFGLYVPGRDLILLRPRMKLATERCILAHEIDHYLHRDRRVNGIYSLRQERRADEGAALRLIPDDRWNDVRRWTHNLVDAAIELQVTLDIALARTRVAA